MNRPRLYGEIVLENTNVTQAQLETALKQSQESNEALGKVLVNMGAISERERVMCLGKRWNVPYVDLGELDIPPEVSQVIPEALQRKYKATPIAVQNNRVTLAMVNPVDILSIDELRAATGLEIEPVIATEEDISGTINKVSTMDEGAAKVLDDVVKQFDGGGDLDIAERELPDDMEAGDLTRLGEDAPVIRLTNMIISQAIRDGASDIHIQPEENRLRVRLRIDGVLQDVMNLPRTVHASLSTRVKVMADMDIAERRRPQDGRISLMSKTDKKSYDFRVSSLPGVNGEKIVLRILDKSAITVGLANLGFNQRDLQLLEDMVRRPNGIFLVTGPTGSGKSTTLYSVLNKINAPEQNILTVEDPVEYQLPGLTQTHVNERAGLTFATVLRSMLRQDPDIIMVGEIRDRETAVIATEAALTGHLVLSTLHTNDAPGAVTRLIEMKIEPFLVSSSLIAVLGQRLVQVVCPRCKEEWQPPQDSLERLGLSDSTKYKDVVFYRGHGCTYCRERGYRGRTGVFELMPVTDEIRDLIIRERPSHEISDAARRAGMTTLREDAIEKVLQGITTIEEALTKVYGGR